MSFQSINIKHILFKNIKPIYRIIVILVSDYKKVL